MKYKRWTLLLILAIVVSSFIKQDRSIEDINKSSFEFYYGFHGLGSNFNQMAPVFRVSGQNFIFTEEKTTYFSFDEEKNNFTIDTLCTGSIRKSSIDSILKVVEHIQDSVFCFNPNIMSGGIDIMRIKSGHKEYYFSMHNCADSAAIKVLQIINSNLKPECDKLYWHSPPKLEDLDSSQIIKW